MILRFFWSTLARFAKTVGCLLFIAGLGVAGWLYRERTPTIDAVRYRQSNMLAERLDRLSSIYADSQASVIKFKGSTDFPPEYAQASFKPQFPQSYSTLKDFQDLHAQLSQVSLGRDAMKRFVTDHFEALLYDIQQKLMAHAASLAPTPASAPQTILVPSTLFFGLYNNDINPSQVKSRKAVLDNSKQFLGVLQTAAENSDNKRELGDSIAEIDALLKLLPSSIEPQSPPPPSNGETKVPLNAERVAARIAEIRNTVRQSILSSWALDEAAKQAFQTADMEQQKFLTSEFEVKQLSGELHVAMAAAFAAGIFLGTFFLLIGDWTKKSETFILYYDCKLIDSVEASPSDVYETVEKAVKARDIPGLISTHELWHEGGALSAKREYLRLKRERLLFEICAAPFGTDFFVSFRVTLVPLVIDPLAIFLFLGIAGAALLVLAKSFGPLWGGIILVVSLSTLVFALRTSIASGLADLDRILLKTPLLGPLYEIFLRPITYYRIDTTRMYIESVDRAVTEAFNSMFVATGVKFIPNVLEKPVLDELYRRMR